MLLNKKLSVAGLCLAILTLPSMPLFAATEVVTAGSIFETRVQVNQTSDMAALLATVPVWQKETITELFQLYLKPIVRSDNQRDIEYTVRFINAYWGPLQNPFNKYPRPAKIIAFPGKSSNVFYLAPIVQNESDKQYYVFSKANKNPMLLSDWLAFIQKKNRDGTPLSVNICTQYGTFPEDSCNQKPYLHEVEETYVALTDVPYSGSQSFALMPNAYRDPDTDWRTMIETKNGLDSSIDTSIVGTAVSWNDINKRTSVLQRSNAWLNYQTIDDNFKKIRDIRFFHDNEKANFLRRASWLYPNDGCWTRAAAVIKGLFGPLHANPVNYFSRPAKVFAFGNLCVNTPNAANGAVSWWYHTAPIIRDKQTGESYVLDPSVDPKKPSLMSTWIAAITSRDGACSRHGLKEIASDVTINVCDGYGVSPYDQCQQTDAGRESQAIVGQEYYLKLERVTQNVLGRNADAVLGDSPPW